MDSGFSIPSLGPPRVPSSNDTGKENVPDSLKLGQASSSSSNEISKNSPLHDSSKIKPQPLGHRTPQTLNPNKKKLIFSSSPLPRTSSKTPNKSRSVLRYGETIDSLFCLSRKSTEQQRQLCKNIIEGSLADSPSTWRRVLEMASEGNADGTDLIRLHRRATIRFPVDMLKGEDLADVLAIWLSFAETHAKIGSIEEARRTYRHLENQRVNLGAIFYVKLADFEKDHDKSKVEEILQRGIDKNAEPLSKLKQALQKWRSLDMRTLEPKSTSPKRQIAPFSQEKSSKRLKVEGGKAQRKALAEIRKPVERDAATSVLAVNPGILKSAGKSRSKLLSRKGLSGRAARVDPNMSIANESESEHETDSVDMKTSGASESAKASKAKMKKLDLSYMWEWDPNSRGKTQETTNKEGTTVQRSDEQSTGDPSTSATQVTGSSASTTSSTSVKSNQNAASKQEPSSKEKSQETTKQEPVQEVIDTESERRSRIEALLGGVNQQFLPLVHQNNILQVNGASYAKLGVIGKGGSCKVYRALSKKCAVVAIKKVKLEGMERKAIEGYANEIALLKRLRGNPAIIQMYDSEVDIQRKSIFVVMELGEVDLNHVLRQRALSGADRSLNMNFIRLTWQQMLSAVHCIHEERIIHSDLKPANFLFVRGALKLIDFGIAKAIQSDDTTNIYRESHIGTLNYMSPEAILDTGSGQNGPRMKIGRASDVWSLGCILYEMVFGKTPFAELHFIQKLQAIVNPKHEITFSEDVDEAAVDAIKQCLRRNPDERPPIMGKEGLLNEHRFLHSGGRSRK